MSETVAEYSVAVAKAMPEKELMQNVLDMARSLGYWCYHTFDSRRSSPGFPDIIAVKGKRLLALECKRHGKDLTEAQVSWLMKLQDAGFICRTIRPDDWLDGSVERLLRREDAA